MEGGETVINQTQVAAPLSGNAKRICNMSEQELEQILGNTSIFPGTKAAALRVIRDQEKRDLYGAALLREQLSAQQLESVLLRMSDVAINTAIKAADLPVEPVKIMASRLLDERHKVMRREKEWVRHQAELKF